VTYAGVIRAIMSPLDRLTPLTAKRPEPLVASQPMHRWFLSYNSQEEYYEARDRRKTIVLVLLEGQPAPGLPFLPQLHWIVTADPTSEASLARAE
jgi:hypothetical protein